MQLDSSAPVPLYQQVAADIRRKIVSGEMPVGARIPPHRDLAVQYDVSIITINKALSGLVSEGILYSHVGRGTFVKVRPAATSGIASPITVGFVLRDLSSPFFSLVAHGAQQRADALGVGVIFASSSNRLDREEEQIRRLQTLGVHGMIVVSMSRTSRLSESLQALQESGFPYVMVSYTIGDEVPFVGVNLDTAGYLAGKHLLACGARRLGYVIDRRGSPNGELRMGGFRRAASEAGLVIEPEFTFEHQFDGEWNDYNSGYAIAEQVAKMPVRPDGMFCFNDLTALGLEDGLLDQGVRIPDDVSVVGLDDIELAARARVPLTTLRQPAHDIGARALDHVLAHMRGEQAVIKHLFAPELVVRASTLAPAPAAT